MLDSGGASDVPRLSKNSRSSKHWESIVWVALRMLRSHTSMVISRSWKAISGSVKKGITRVIRGTVERDHYNYECTGSV